jgi:hypothetical protein
MGYFPFKVSRLLVDNYLHNTTSGPNIEMIELSTLEWLILLMVVIVFVWILIILQARSFGSHQFELDALNEHNRTAGGNSGTKGIENA